MKVLITGPLKGNTERLKGLIDVAQPDLTVVIGPLELREPLKLGKSWFFVRGLTDSLDVLTRSDGVDLLSKVFRTKEGVTFSGLSGVYHPATQRLTRQQWIKARGKIGKRERNYLFKEDYDGLIVPFRNSPVERLDFLVIADSPHRPPIKAVIEETKPKYVFYPANEYRKERVEGTTYISLESISSPRGKYILHL